MKEIKSAVKGTGKGTSKGTRKGFTVMEALIAVAVVAIIGVVVVGIFIASSNANARARNIDFASARCSSLIELIKGQKYFEEVPVMAEFINSAVTRRDDAGVEITMAYDKSWAGLRVEDALKLPDDSRFKLVISVYRDGGPAGSEGVGVLMAIKATAIDLNASASKSELASYETHVYFDETPEGWVDYAGKAQDSARGFIDDIVSAGSFEGVLNLGWVTNSLIAQNFDQMQITAFFGNDWSQVTYTDYTKEFPQNVRYLVSIEVLNYYYSELTGRTLENEADIWLTLQVYDIDDISEDALVHYEVGNDLSFR